MVLDWRDQSVIPRKEAHCDVACRGRNKCSAHFDIKDAVIPDIEPFEIVLPGGHATPEEALAKNEEIMKRRRKVPEQKLSVGDLSVVNEPKRKNRVKDGQRYLRNREKGLTVGDHSVVTDERESIEARVDADLARKDESLTVGDLFRGMRPNDFAPSTSAEILMEMQRKQREKREEVRHICTLLAGGKDQRLEEYVDKYLKNKA
jgi:hypothetical protein